MKNVTSALQIKTVRATQYEAGTNDQIADCMGGTDLTLHLTKMHWAHQKCQLSDLQVILHQTSLVGILKFLLPKFVGAQSYIVIYCGYYYTLGCCNFQIL